MKIDWIDSGREPQCAPNPKYPMGIDVDMSDGAAKTCTTALPYPAKRCGAYIIECPKCGQRVGITTAGRPDDPRSAKLACWSQFIHGSPGESGSSGSAVR